MVTTDMDIPVSGKRNYFLIRLFPVLALCVFFSACAGREKPAKQAEEDVSEVEIYQEQETEKISSTVAENSFENAVIHQPQRQLPSLSGIGGRVNVSEIDPLNYENPDLDILRKMGAEQYLISFLAGEQLYKSGNIDRALTEYTVSINQNSEFIEALISRGNAWLKKKEYSRAIDDYSRAIRLNNNRAELYNYRGFARAELASGNRLTDESRMREYNLAIEDFTRAIALNRNYADALINRSHVFYQTENYDRVIQDCDSIIRLEPQNAYIWNRRGSAWYHKKEDDRAIRDFTEAIKIRNNYAVAYYNRANAWYNKGELDKALEDMEASRKY